MSKETLQATLAVFVCALLMGAWMKLYVAPRDERMWQSYMCATERVGDTASYEEHKAAYIECAEELALERGEMQ